ncbi:hypothetical protein AGMMS49991_10400 [Spirochaetia bacterium]|nr:hypothetical protein AGMMS49991_10400 [Spirochaetia bacterium]
MKFANFLPYIGYKFSITVNERIKEVRHTVKMTQPQFTQAIYISKQDGIPD